MVDEYVKNRPKLKYHNKIIDVVSRLCESERVSVEKFREDVCLSADGFSTVLSNVTMAIQGEGSVKPLSLDGWYAKENEELILNPSFRKAWQDYFSIKQV